MGLASQKQRKLRRARGRPGARSTTRTAAAPLVAAALLVASAVLSVEDGYGSEPPKAGAADQQQGKPKLAAPTKLVVTAATDASITISWTAATDEKRTITGYRLYRDADEDAEPIATTSETTFTFAKLKCGSSYALSLEAVDADGNRSERISIMSATTGCPDRTGPSAPDQLAQTAADETSASLSWVPSADNAAGVIGYGVYHGELLVATTTDPSFTFAGLSCGSSYRVGVDSFDASGNRSARTSFVLTTSACPSGGSDGDSSSGGAGEAGGGSSSDGQSGDGGGEASAGSGGAESGGGAETAGGETTPPDAGGGSEAGDSDASDTDDGETDSAETAAAPGNADGARGGRTALHAPTDLRQTEQAETSVGVAWSASGGAVRYIVSRDRARVGATQHTTFTLSGLTCGTSYTVGVRARGPHGNRSRRATVVVSTSACSQPPPPPGSDTEAPSTPGELTVASSTDTSASLAWQPATDNVEVTGYGLYADGVLLGTTGETSHIFDGLVCGTTYRLGVDAYDAAGNRSDPVSELVTTSDCDDPGSDGEAPTAPSHVALAEATRDSLAVSWPASSDNVGVEGYIVSLDGVTVGVSPDTSFTYTGLSCGRSYGVSVAAYDAAGNQSEQASDSFATSECEEPSVDDEPPTAPADLAMTSSTHTSVSLVWSPASDNVGVAGYGVYRNGDRVAATDRTSFTLTGLACGTSYEVDVDAYDDAGNRSAHATAVVTTAACSDTEAPSTPADVTQTNRTQTSISVRWSASTDNVGVVGYGLYLDGSLVGTTAQTSFTFSNLTCGTSYTLSVDGYDAVGNRSGRSSVRMTTSACPDTTPPSTPTNFRRTGATETTIALAWDASTDNIGVAGYGVYLAGTAVGTAPATTYIVSGLACGTTYSLAVDAYDAGGNRSGKASLSAATSACQPSGGGALLVSPGGSDSNACTLAAPCQSFDRAYRAAQPGQIVDVAGGTYPAQVIRRDAAKTSSNDVTFRPASGASVTINGALTLYGSSVTVEDMRVNGDVNIDGEYRTGARQDDITVRNLDATAVHIISATNVNVLGGDYGPSDHNSGVRRTGTMPTNILFDGATFHDYDCNGCHIEGIIVGAVDGLTIRNSKFWRNEVYNIFFQGFNGSISNVLLENNWFAASRGPNGEIWPHNVRFSRDYTYTNVLVRYNSFNGNAFALGGVGQNFRVVGNVGRLDQYDPPGGCGTGAAYAYNVWQNGSCSPTDRNLNGAPLPYVRASNEGDMDYHLTGGVAVDLVPGSDGDQQLGSDIDGNGRPAGAGYDAGSDELR